MRVFIIEDDESIRGLTLYALENAGFEAEGFETAAEFRARASREVPDLLLLDLMLPGEDGLSLLRSLRRSPATERLPVIVVTARDGELDRVRGLDAGADDYIAKPFSVLELLSRVRALLRRTAPAERAEAQRRSFSANVSHELKTPLTTILGYSELIASGQVSEADAARFAGLIQREATRLIRLVEDIIYLSELEERTDPGRDRLMLYTLTDEVVQSLAPAAERSGVTVHIEGGQFELAANRRMVFGMIYNLVDNAIKYNKPGGTVTVRLAAQEGEIVIAVQDTGIGIPADCLDRLFERFYRVDASRSKRTGGTGLGLSIVKHVALCHGGTVRADSVEGEGTTITVRLPKTAAMPPA